MVLDDAERLEDLAAAAARAAAFRLAVSDGRISWTYGDLWEGAAHVASELKARGVVPGEPVGLMIESRVLIPVVVTGIFRAGASYVPIDPQYPRRRRNYLVSDSGIRLLVRARIDSTGRPDFQFDVTKADPPLILPASTAYVCYTSGSTGPPKGVVVRHDNVLSMLRGAAEQFAFRCDDRWLQLNSFSFDFSVWEVWGCLASSATLVAPVSTVASNPYELMRYLQAWDVTILNVVPAVFAGLRVAAARRGTRFDALRYVVLGGEAARMIDVAEWRRLGCAPGARVINMYGTTESTVHATFADITDLVDSRRGETLIGRPLPGYAIRIVDDSMSSLGEGERGEILIGGAGIGSGYLNRPQLTASRFVTLAGSGTRWYRSGDIGVMRDGQLWYIGRQDDQVQVNGYRVELGEVEWGIMRTRWVRECVVVAPRNRNSTILVALYVPGSGAPSGTPRDRAQLLRAEVASTLPAYMVPAAFKEVEWLPRSINGKIDRAKSERMWTG